jgi:hypothetical protein
MKLLLAIILAAGLVGCGHNQHGIRVYTPVTSAGADGSSKGGTALLISINGDIPGLSEVPTPMGPIRIDTTVQGQGSRVVLNKKGEVVGTETYPVLAGLNTSEVTRAQGEADKSRIKEAAAGVTGAALSLGAAAAAGPAAQGLVNAIPVP